MSESVRLKSDIWGTQREILRKRPKNSNKVGIKLSEAILSILRDCWEKTYLFLTSPSKTDGRVPSEQGAPTTCNLTYWEEGVGNWVGLEAEVHWEEGF